ncbi:hypothetical protein [Leptothoe kymatousa]|uniref:Uncharacterized protein n=1 Tax=Leptothoe kymatousa TAU-MAC 1615 TaxID=2364775 RepID=A0ABS5Y2T7_9CYAN|nr:hypothetical protein [Leptothoe kymatousa]MBT9312159.1 hypothetical protein [Leptothoe kymatousa TAU-MAC 1615]
MVEPTSDEDKVSKEAFREEAISRLKNLKIASLERRFDEVYASWSKAFARLDKYARLNSVREKEQQKEVLLTTEISENVSTEEVSAELATLCKALNAYHIACGGNGLEIDDWETLVAVRELAGV